MNDTHGFWWGVLDTVSGIALGALGLVGAAVGWLSNQFKAVNTRMDAMEQEFTERTQVAAMNIVRLEAYHVSNTQRLDSIENTTRGIDAKLDRLIEGISTNRRS